MYIETRQSRFSNWNQVDTCERTQGTKRKNHSSLVIYLIDKTEGSDKFCEIYCTS